MSEFLILPWEHTVSVYMGLFSYLLTHRSQATCWFIPFTYSARKWLKWILLEAFSCWLPHFQTIWERKHLWVLVTERALHFFHFSKGSPHNHLLHTSQRCFFFSFPKAGVVSRGLVTISMGFNACPYEACNEVLFIKTNCWLRTEQQEIGIMKSKQEMLEMNKNMISQLVIF